MREEWYVELDGAVSGPHVRDVLLQMRESGRVRQDTRVRRSGLRDWMCYADADLEPTRSVPAMSAMQAGNAWPDLAPAAGEDAQGAPTPTWSGENKPLAELPSAAPRLEVDDDGWQWVKPSPWRRYFARSLDMVLLGSVVWVALYLVTAMLGTSLFEVVFARNGMMHVPLLAAVAVMASLMPAQALLIGLSGMTPGKWFFGVRVTRRDGRAIGLRNALLRELSVFGLGLGCGIPVVAFVPIGIGYHVLTRTGATQWDRGKDWVVTQRPPGDWQNVMAVLGIALLFASWAFIRSLAGLSK